MTVRSPPRSLAAAAALSAARRSPTPSAACAGAVATPTLKATPGPESTKLRCVARRRRSATMKAPRSSVSGSSSANSSPAMRAATSMRRFHLSAFRATGRVAVLLVHRPEAVDVAHDHGHRAVAAECALELQLEQLLERAAVDQP